MTDRYIAAYRSDMKWGQKIDHRDPTKPGWREDPKRPGVDRYWTGSAWDETIPPRSTPNTSWVAVLLGLVLAAALIFTIIQVAG